MHIHKHIHLELLPPLAPERRLCSHVRLSVSQSVCLSVYMSVILSMSRITAKVMS